MVTGVPAAMGPSVESVDVENVAVLVAPASSAAGSEVETARLGVIGFTVPTLSVLISW
jgi:hypothetical protein